MLGKTLSVLPETYLPKPVRNLCHCGHVAKSFYAADNVLTGVRTALMSAPTAFSAVWAYGIAPAIA